jgi:hypothetical protein
MTMKRSIRRVSIAVASMALVGGTVLGAGGSASAATARPTEHNRSSVVTSVNDSGRDGRHADRHGHGGRHQTSHRLFRDGHRLYFWDGHHLFVREDSRWIDATPLHNGSIDLWYVGQLLNQR